jgi:hypothetical protein
MRLLEKPLIGKRRAKIHGQTAWFSETVSVLRRCLFDPFPEAGPGSPDGKDVVDIPYHLGFYEVQG